MNEIELGKIERIKAGLESATFEELKALFRPEGVENGVMEVDPEKCTHCGLCIKNCPFGCWELGKDKVPAMIQQHICFSCSNCMVACPVDAISMLRPFNVKNAFFDTDFPETRMPAEPMNVKGEPDQWNEVEKVIFNRRSVRNYKKDPVPEPLIRRVLEAGRFSPSGGNQQPWKFAVVTNPAVIEEIETACHQFWVGMYEMFSSDEKVMGLLPTIPVGVFDPRVQWGIRCIAKKELPIFLGAPVVIFIGVSKKMTGPEMHTGICGQNMNLAAASLGLGFCWSNFGSVVNYMPEVMKRLGFDETWSVHSTACIGFPKFKQQGVVARHFRPVTWFRPGSDEPQLD
ncbi:MAG: nitroreductase family protein [Pseudomonadota bacterium]